MTFKRPHKRIAELERELMLARGSLDMARQDWAYVCGRFRAMSGKEPCEDTIPEKYRRYYRTGYEEQTAAIVPGYEPYTLAAIDAIRSTCQTQADRAGMTQDEVFSEAEIAREYDKTLAAIDALPTRYVSEEPPPAKDDAQ